MEIILNNQKKEVSEQITLAEIIFSQLGEKQKGIAAAVNDTVISKLYWETTKLNSNDNILIIKATQGG